MLHSKLQVIETTALEFLEERELVPDISEYIGIIVESFFVGDREPRW